MWRTFPQRRYGNTASSSDSRCDEGFQRTNLYYRVDNSRLHTEKATHGRAPG